MRSYFFRALLIIFVAIYSLATAFADSNQSFHKIVFFGDSLSDNGNLYYYDFSYMPKSPPYYEGRFSNGVVWSEHAAAYYAQAKNIDSTNYAFGGESAVLHDVRTGHLPYSLTASIDSYLLHSIFRDRSQILFVIWIGANDYLDNADKPEETTEQVIGSIKDAIEKLAYHGGENFLVINLPDLGRTPYARGNGTEEQLTTITKLHNTKLQAMVAEIQQDYSKSNIHIFDMNASFTDFLDNTSAFNANNHLNITDTQGSCWQGGYHLRSNVPVANAQTIAEQMQTHIKNHPQALVANANANQNIDVNEFANTVVSTPALMEAYHVAQLADDDAQPCSNPDNYIFWDHLHPTAVVHQAIANLVIDFINKNYNPI